MVDVRLANLFRHFRNHQKSLWNGGGMLTTFPSGRTERTFASAPFGEHAKSAWINAKRHAHFVDEMTGKGRR